MAMASSPSMERLWLLSPPSEALVALVLRLSLSSSSESRLWLPSLREMEEEEAEESMAWWLGTSCDDIAAADDAREVMVARWPPM